jgi:predicted nucleotidyltransferase
MLKNALQTTIHQLSLSPRVKGIFTTGSTATGLAPSSDIDLVVILDDNREGIKSAYTMIEGKFADIFFFDLAFVKRCAKLNTIPANGFEGIFLTWLAKGRIEKDEREILTNLKTTAQKKVKTLKISTEEKRDHWFKINYNYIANKRYFNSDNGLYHDALEFRLLYSVSELIVAYFVFRDIPWRGEKEAVMHLKKDDRNTYACFTKYFKSQTVNDRYMSYAKLFKRVLVSSDQQWDKDFLVIVNSKHQIEESLTTFWNKLLVSEKAIVKSK